MANRDRSFGINVLAVSKGLEQVGRGVEKLGRTLDEFDRKIATATVDVETRKAEAKVGRFARDLKSRVERAVRSLPDIELRADSSDADRRIAEIRRELATLSSKRIGVDVDASQAQARIERLSSELSRLSRQSPNVQVRADTAAASAALLGVSAAADRLDGRNVSVAVSAAGVSRAISLIGLLTAGLAAAAAMAGPAAAALAAIGPAVGSAAQGIGALAAGFSGVGDAVKALSNADKKAAAGTAVSAASRVSSAQAIANAQIAVQRATERADRAAILGAQQVEDARRALADAHAAAARRVESAERALTRAQRTSQRAQEDLTRARAEAREELEDLGRSLRGAVLDEEEAQLRLAEAQEALAKGRAQGVTGRDLQRLDLDARQAALALEEARDRHQDLQQEQQEANRTGVAGSERVVAAQERVTDAAEGVRDAERALAQARADGARAVEDAQRGLARAVQQAAFAQQDAAAGVADAQRALAQAYTDAGNVGATSLNAVKEAMEGLSPAAQRFAHFLVDEVLPGLKGIRDAVQATLLPRMETALRNLGKLTPVVSAGLAETGRVIGDLAIRGSEMMSSGPWQRDFATIMASNNRVLESFGSAGLSVADAFRSITVAAGPMVERFARFVEQSALAFDSFITGARATGDLDRWFAQMSDTLAELGQIFGQIITGLLNLQQALGPLGMILLRTVGVLVELIGSLAAANPLLTQIAASVLIGVAAFNAIGKAVAGAALAAGVATSGWKLLGGALAGIAPAAMVARLSGMQRGLDAVSLSAGVLTERFTRSATAGERVATAGSRVAGVATRVGAALPVVGLAVVGVALAWDGLVLSADEAARAMLQGGAAAEQAARQLQTQGRVADALRSGWVLSIPIVGAWAGMFADKLSPGVDQANEALQRMQDQMTPLQLAQANATSAANAYGQAVKHHGPSSLQAAQASGILAIATDKVEQEQLQAANATKSLTDKLIEQRDTMLGSIDAEIRYEAAVDALTESIATNGRTIDLNTAAGRGNMQALQELSKAAIAHLQAMADQGAGVDAVTAKERVYRDSLIQAAIQTGMTREEARRYVDQLHLIPPHIATKVTADTGPASREIDAFIRSAQGRRIILQAQVETGNITALGVRAAGGIDYRPMAAGGLRSMASGIANVVPARTPTLIGDHPSVPESYIPHNRSPRSHRILDVTAAAMGRTILPMAAGGAMSSDIAWPRRVAALSDTRTLERISAVLGTLRGLNLPTAGGGAADWQALVPQMRAAFTTALRDVFAAGIKTDVDWDRLTWRIDQVQRIRARR